MEQTHRTYGFRFSIVDGLVLVATLAATPPLVTGMGVIGWLPAYVVGHFFLFCNVFRIRRRPELIWAAFFVAVVTTVSALSRDAFWMLILPLPLTVVLIGRELRHPSYHGILAVCINPAVVESRRPA